MDSNHWSPDTLPDARTTTQSVHNTVMLKRFNREKLVQEQLSDKKNDQKTTISFEKDDVRNDKTRQRNDHLLHLKDDINDVN